MSKRAKQEAQALFSKTGKGTSMAKKVKQSDVSTKTETLRALRLADEESRRAAGTWGEMTVGEIVHEDTHSVFVEVWKGAQRPDPFRPGAARGRGVPVGEWLVITTWVNAMREAEFSRTVIARDITEEAARKIVQARIAERLADGYKVMNPAEVAAQ